jgi:hypothetical protein
MKKFWTDWAAIGFAAVGIVLMAFTIAWRINPAEGSVIPQFLKDNFAGEAVHLVLLITCMPVWCVAVLLISDTSSACVVAMFFIQGLVYFLIGKAVAVTVRKLLRKKEASAPEVQRMR